MQRVVFGATGWAIDFKGCEDVVAALPLVFKGWNLKTGTPAEMRVFKPRARITRQSNGWNWEELGAPKARDWDPIPPRSAMRVVTDVHDAAIYWYLADNPHLLCLHGGAARIGSGLVCFPARGRAGKSTLMAHLAALGHQVFADDVLGLEPKGNRGLALGFMPRLRTPLPANLAPEIRDYIAGHTAFEQAGWLYLKPGARQIAGLGVTAKIKALVTLERFDQGPSVMAPVNESAILKNLIAENIIRQLPMVEIFDRLHRLAAASQRFHLRYSDPLEAAQFLSRTLA